MRVTFLGSGSGGNATAVTSGDTTILIDVGFSAHQTAQRLAEAGIDTAQVRAVFVTHEHVDHVSGLDVFCRRHATDSSVHMTAGTVREIRPDARWSDRVGAVAVGDDVRVGSLVVRAFRTAHDAAQPVGYVIENAAGVRFGLATDTGHVTAEALEALAGCNALAIETNHDLEMLRTGPYPYFLQRRIASDTGHLSNVDAATTVNQLAHDGLTRLIAVHVSRTNNTAELADSALRTCAERLGLAAAVCALPQHGTVVVDL